MTWWRLPRLSPIAELTDRDLVRLYWPAQLRSAFDALFAIDDALAEVVNSSTQPALGAIRLAWWREALERLDTSPPPPEPRLKAAAAELLPLGITGKELAALEDGWAGLLDEEPDLDRVEERGARLFAIGAKLLAANDPFLELAGRIHASAQIRRMRGAAFAQASVDPSNMKGHRFPRRLRPLTALARLGARDFKHGMNIEREATPGRAAALLRHFGFGFVA